jgi:hypothetical protein
LGIAAAGFASSDGVGEQPRRQVWGGGGIRERQRSCLSWKRRQDWGIAAAVGLGNIRGIGKRRGCGSWKWRQMQDGDAARGGSLAGAGHPMGTRYPCGWRVWGIVKPAMGGGAGGGC